MSIYDNRQQLACSGGHPDVIDWKLDSFNVVKAIKGGDIDFIKNNRIKNDSLYCDTAARNNQFEILKILRQKGCDWDYHTSKEACESGNLPMLKWIINNGCECLFVSMASEAACNGHLHILKWLYKKGHLEGMIRDFIRHAILYEQVHVVEWLLSIECICDKDICDDLAMYGMLDILKSFDEKGILPELDEETTESAALGGHLEILKWLKERGCKWNSLAYSGAVDKGFLEVAEWLKENGCPTIN